MSSITDLVLGVPLWALSVALGVALLGLVLAVRWRRRGGPDAAALRRLGAALELRRSDRRLLQRLADEGGLPHPASLLLSRGAFDRATAAFAARHGWSARLDAITARAWPAEEPPSGDAIGADGSLAGPA